MNQSKPTFAIDLGALKSTDKTPTKQQEKQAEAVAEDLGFIARESPKKRGRKPSPRTGQVHAKVLPEVSKEIAAEAKQRGVQQGVVIEEAWFLYKSGKK